MTPGKILTDVTQKTAVVRPETVTFEQFAVARLPSLLRYAVVLTGDRELAQDVVQEVLARAQVRWRRISEADSPEAYVRRMILNEYNHLDDPPAPLDDRQAPRPGTAQASGAVEPVPGPPILAGEQAAVRLALVGAEPA
jgi:sigma-70-like protein